MTNLSKANWDLASCGSNAVADVAALPAAKLGWASVNNVTTVASALAQLGVWSLDAAAQRFDSLDWWWRTAFPRPETVGDMWLCFDGIATLADVWLNGELILRSRNMFQQHEVQVTRLLGPYNDLVICCRALDVDRALKRSRPRWRAPMVEHQQLRWYRTTLLGRTPGWSPPVAAVGPWREVRLEQRELTRLQDVAYRCEISVSPNGRTCGSVHMSATVVGDAAELCKQGLELVVKRAADQWRAAISIDAAAPDKIHSSVTIIDVELWWPHTHGDPALYQASLSLPDSAPSALHNTQQHAPKMLGFRSVELDLNAGNFRLTVNDVAVFCRGAVWTPLDIVTLAAEPMQYRVAVEQARSAGMNMLRVAGTNVYELPAFYDACDAAGIMVWQDLMFANMQYPADDVDFLQNVHEELAQQLTRIGQHPCCALWCGNSEVEQQAAMFGAERALWKSSLFYEAIPALIALHGHGIPYVASSACNPIAQNMGTSPPQFDGFPHQANLGCTSYYGVGAYLRPLQDAQLSQLRFASECLAFAHVPDDAGIAAMPNGLSLRTHHPIWKQRTPRDVGAGWDFEDVRDHYLKSLFAVEPAHLRSVDHDRYLALSRVVTGEVILAAFSQWRAVGSACDGALLLFFKDLWAGAGWGLIDATGQPKAAFYYARRAMSALALFVDDHGGNGMYANFVNDANTAVDGDCQLRLLRDGHVEVASVTRHVAVAAHSAATHALASWFDHFYDLSYAYRFGPPSYDVLHLRWIVAGTTRDAYFLPGGLQVTAVRADIGLCGQVTRTAPNHAKLVLSSLRFAQSVEVRVNGYRCVDNYVHVAPGASVAIDLVSASLFTPETRTGSVIDPTTKGWGAGPDHDTQPTLPISGTLSCLNSSVISKVEWLPEESG